MVGSGLIRVVFAVVTSTLLALVACASEPSAGAGPASERLLARWSAHPVQAPSTRPDLAEVRQVLDRITDDLLAQLTATQGLRADPGCPAQLASAQRRVELARALDQVHSDALGRALTSLCRAPHADGAGVAGQPGRP